jgi:hypothetical protein
LALWRFDMIYLQLRFVSVPEPRNAPSGAPDTCFTGVQGQLRKNAPLAAIAKESSFAGPMHPFQRTQHAAQRADFI